METLFVIGKKALPQLLSAVATSDSAELRDNAAATVMLIYRDSPPDGVEYLRKAAD